MYDPEWPDICERCGRTAVSTRIAELQTVLALRDSQLKALVELQRAAALRMGRAYALLVGEWRAEVEEAEERLRQKKQARPPKNHGAGSPTDGVAENDRAATDAGLDELWSAGATWSGVGTGRVMPPAALGPAARAQEKGGKPKAAGKRLPRVARLMGPMPPPCARCRGGQKSKSLWGRAVVKRIACVALSAL